MIVHRLDKHLRNKQKVYKIKRNKKAEEYKETNELTKKYDYHAGKESPSNLRQKEIFNKIVDERREKIIFSNLTY